MFGVENFYLIVVYNVTSPNGERTRRLNLTGYQRREPLKIIGIFGELFDWPNDLTNSPLYKKDLLNKRSHIISTPYSDNFAVIQKGKVAQPNRFFHFSFLRTCLFQKLISSGLSGLYDSDMIPI